MAIIIEFKKKYLIFFIWDHLVAKISDSKLQKVDKKYNILHIYTHKYV
jgi:hypothetical protein